MAASHAEWRYNGHLTGVDREPGAPTAPDYSPVARRYLGVIRKAFCKVLRESLSFFQRTGRRM